MLKTTEKELSEQFSSQYSEVKLYMTENVEKMLNVTQNSAQNLASSLKQIKTVCSNYFQHYELDLEELRLRIGTLENKYKDWSKVLIEPATMNDARVFALESRMEKEEEVRIYEYDFIKDLIKKLVYSLEQLSIQHLDAKETNKQATHENFFPTLLNGPSQLSNKKGGQDLTQTMEVMMMKRMNYIRNNLDVHNPREVTSKIRQDAK